MTAKDAIKLLEKLPQDHELCFLCPDGFLDEIEPTFVVEDEQVIFGSYIHREHHPDRFKDWTSV